MRSLVLALVLLSAAVGGAEVKPFTFVHFSDTHVGSEGTEERLKQALEDVDKNFPEAAFIVISGDTTEFGRVDEFNRLQAILKTSKRPIHPGIGNHDVRWSESGKENFRNMIGPTYESFEHNGMKFFLLDVSMLIEHYGHFDGQQMAQLEKELKAMPDGMPAAMVMHHPPCSPGHFIDNEFQFADLITQYNVPLICNGHMHALYRYSFNGIEFCMGGSVSNSGAPPRSYRVYEVTADTIQPITRIYDRNKTTREEPFATKPKALPKLTVKVPNTTSETRTLEFETLLDDAPITAPVGVILDHVTSYGLDLEYGKTLRLDQASMYPGLHQLTVLVPRDVGTTVCRTVTFTSRSYDAEKHVLGKLPLITRTFPLKSGCQSHPAVDGDVLYVGANDGLLRAIDLADEKGRVIWEANLNREILAAPAVTTESVVVASMDSHVYCLNKEDGTVRWKYKTDQAVSASPLVTSDTVYIGSGDFKMYAFDLESGEKKWEFAATRLIKATPALANGRLFFGAWDNIFYCLDAANGKLIWKIPVSHKGNGHFSAGTSNPVVSGENLIFCSHDYTVRCISQDTGGTLWAYRPTKEELGPSYSTAVIKDGVAYFGSISGHVLGFDVERGQKVFDVNVRPSKKDDLFDSLPLLVGDKICIGSVNGNLYCVSIPEKKVAWSIALQPGFIFTKPVAWKDRILTGSLSDKVFEVKHE